MVWLRRKPEWVRASLSGCASEPVSRAEYLTVPSDRADMGTAPRRQEELWNSRVRCSVLTLVPHKIP